MSKHIMQMILDSQTAQSKISLNQNRTYFKMVTSTNRKVNVKHVWRPEI